MVQTVRLGGTDIEVAAIGHGLMLMTWTPTPVSDEQAFEAIIKGVDAAGGAKVLLNSGEFYGENFSTTNLELLARFYKKYPEYADKTVLSVKGGVDLANGHAISRYLYDYRLAKPHLSKKISLEFLRKSIDNINAKLEGTKHVDIFEAARVDPNRSIEEAMNNMKTLIEEGKFSHVGLSECSAETLRRANAVVPVAAVEIEVSPFSYEEETRKVIATAKELNIPVAAYSPLGRGFLTGQITKLEDILEGDMRHQSERFKPHQTKNFPHNLTLVDALKTIAAKKGVSPGQLALAWVRSLGPHMLPIPGSSKASRTIENLQAADIILTEDEKAEINGILDTIQVKGARYQASTPGLWG
ncbi:hypothetical protein M422DRAFT_33413 [Sphaerobolus stellatus SS14]|uniref:NADP-dependent oxidoreductase domain-containing protein n=1 Tax=Sphaerobolus stellatus (strain SS14) TaxID=990650 RepID=A0A0C9VK32_SPHS4|nr:hypothetical protein M422DRAFT_33413 [Sphaerobolus stellatus SS14]